VFAFIVDHKLSVVKVVLDLMQSIWSKVLGFRIISSRKRIIFMQFFRFFISWTSDSQKTDEAFDSGFFWSNHRTGLVFKTMVSSQKERDKTFRPCLATMFCSKTEIPKNTLVSERKKKLLFFPIFQNSMFLVTTKHV
jgi:hypothetical protein